MKQNEVPESWLRAWSILQMSSVNSFSALEQIAAAAFCDSHVPRALKAFGYIHKGKDAIWRIIPGVTSPNWLAVRQWIAAQRGKGAKTVKKEPAFATELDVIEYARPLRRAGWKVELRNDEGVIILLT